MDEINAPIDAELSFIGACFWHPDRMDETTLAGNDFDHPTLGLLFDRMLERHRTGQGVSQSLLCEDFPEQQRDIWRSTDFISEMNAAGAIEELILSRSLRRRIREAAIKIGQLAGTHGDRSALVDEVRAIVDAATDSRSDAEVTSMVDDIREVLAEHRSSVTLVPSPWRALNEVIVGFGPGRMYVIGARPGVGKSALALQIAYELADKGPVIFASLEMDKGELYSRIVSQQEQIAYSLMGSHLPGALAVREDAWIDGKARDIRVLDAGSQSVQTIRAAARSASRSGRLGGVVVDYIHLLTSADGENETTRIAAITGSSS